MSTDLWLSAFAIVALLAVSFFFSGSETAITAASRARMHQLANSGSSRANLVERLSAEKERVIGAILLGNNIVNILASTLAASVLIRLFGEAGIVYATVAMTAAVVVFSEVLPKTLAILRPDSFALAVAPVLSPIVRIFAPVTLGVQALVRAILRVFGVSPDRGRDVTGHEEIRDTVNLLHSEGEVMKPDRDRLGGLLDLKELDVADIMVHRTKMVALDIEDPPAELLRTMADGGFSRVPLYRGSTDNIIGILHVRDALRAILAQDGQIDRVDLAPFVSRPWFVPDTTPVEVQLNAFLKRKSHFALVVDEYGDVQGHVTLEDVLEEIVGDISDEHDIAIEGLRPLADGGYLVNGELSIRDLNRALDWNLPESDEFTSAAGLVIHIARTIPEEGQRFEFRGFAFTVVRRVRNRIAQIEVHRLPGGASEPD